MRWVNEELVTYGGGKADGCQIQVRKNESWIGENRDVSRLLKKETWREGWKVERYGNDLDMKRTEIERGAVWHRKLHLPRNQLGSAGSKSTDGFMYIGSR